MKYALLIYLFFCLLSQISAQENKGVFQFNKSKDPKNEKVKSTEFSIPPSPAFVMLDVTPSKIIKPGLPRAFKVDWSLKNYSIAPNLALEAQPIWLLGFNKKDLKHYRKASPIMRSLSTLTISAGTVAINDSSSWVAYGGKINLYREKDPLLDLALDDSLQQQFGKKKRELEINIKEIELELLKLNKEDSSYASKQDSLFNEIEIAEQEIIQINISRSEMIEQIRSSYIRENWNSSYLDAAFGTRYTTRSRNLDSIELQGRRRSFWINGSYGIGNSLLLSSMLQFSQDTRLDFSQVMFGVNIRYGNGNYNFFIETYIERNSFRGFKFNDNYIAYGGEFLLNKNIILDYSLRVRNVKNLGFKEFLPVVNFRCLMR